MIKIEKIGEEYFVHFKNEYPIHFGFLDRLIHRKNKDRVYPLTMSAQFKGGKREIEKVIKLLEEKSNKVSIQYGISSTYEIVYVAIPTNYWYLEDNDIVLKASKSPTKLPKCSINLFTNGNSSTKCVLGNVLKDYLIDELGVNLRDCHSLKYGLEEVIKRDMLYCNFYKDVHTKKRSVLLSLPFPCEDDNKIEKYKGKVFIDM